jgi:peptide deformylase
MKEPMTLVKPADIPAAGPTPLDNLIPLFRVCTQMERLCTDSDGIGLSAVQVGIPWKLYIILNRRTDTYEYFIDCEYEGIGEKQTSLEGCLSCVIQTG